MTAPRMILLAGSNGAGKTSCYETVIEPQLPDVPFVNADQIAAQRWPEQTAEERAARAYEAARIAAQRRDQYLASGTSFVAETVFSHPSKVELIRRAKEAGFDVTLVIVHVDVELAVRRVAQRVAAGGHHVPRDKIEGRHARLYPLLREALPLADRAILMDNVSSVRGHRTVADLRDGRVYWADDDHPDWAVELLGGI